ncbi:MAG: hypothetical protein ACWA47_09730 [Brevirhabdus sp.]
MSNSDSFIEEVNEELQRDQLFALMRKYGWIAALAVIVLVGGAAFNEYRKASARTQAQALGDGIRAALENGEGLAAFDGIEAEGDAAALLALLKAGQTQDVAARVQAIDSLRALSTSGDVDPIYRDLAALKLVIVEGADAPVQDRLEQLEVLATPGAPFRVVAMEQKALVLVEAGRRDEALEVLRQLVNDQETTAGLRQRVTQMIVSLGGELEAA